MIQCFYGCQIIIGIASRCVDWSLAHDVTVLNGKCVFFCMVLMPLHGWDMMGWCWEMAILLLSIWIEIDALWLFFTLFNEWGMGAFVSCIDRVFCVFVDCHFLIWVNELSEIISWMSEFKSRSEWFTLILFKVFDIPGCIGLSLGTKF